MVDLPRGRSRIRIGHAAAVGHQDLKSEPGPGAVGTATRVPSTRCRRFLPAANPASGGGATGRPLARGDRTDRKNHPAGVCPRAFDGPGCHRESSWPLPLGRARPRRRGRQRRPPPSRSWCQAQSGWTSVVGWLSEKERRPIDLKTNDRAQVPQFGGAQRALVPVRGSSRVSRRQHDGNHWCRRFRG